MQSRRYHRARPELTLADPPAGDSPVLGCEEAGFFPFGVDPSGALRCLAGRHGSAGDRGPSISEGPPVLGFIAGQALVAQGIEQRFPKADVALVALLEIAALTSSCRL